MSFKHLHILSEDDDDPMLSAVNLVDVFLVLVVALLTAVAARSGPPAADERVTIVRNAGSPDMEIVVRENGREVKYKGTGEVGAGQGERAGVAYRLEDGRIVYVPEAVKDAAAAAGQTLGKASGEGDGKAVDRFADRTVDEAVDGAMGRALGKMSDPGRGAIGEARR